MKKTVIVLLCLTFSSVLFAQEDCKMCGDWIGTYQALLAPQESADYKIHVRIKEYDDGLSVRIKTYPKSNPDNIKYWGDGEVSEVTLNTISFVAHSGESYGWDDTDVINGRIIYKASYDYICTMRYIKGKILLSFYIHTSYYDKHDILIGTEDTPGTFEYSLFKEDDDW